MTAARIRPATATDMAAMLRLWNQCANVGETIYSPMDPAMFERKFAQPDGTLLMAEAQGGLAGWVHGTDDTGDAGYLTTVLVEPAQRGKGIATQLVSALEAWFHERSKRFLAVSGNNPVHLDWRVPGTPGHDHNNAPGVDEAGMGYPFLLSAGYQPHCTEVAMYRNLAGYQWPDAMDAIEARLAREGIRVGPYDGRQALAFDAMCDRVGSEAWRNVLRQELDAWRRNAPCADETLWPDGIRPDGPRPLLLAVSGDQIVGFTGPVAVQRSGRGWFTGICVDPMYGRRQIGKLLFHQLLRAFTEQGATFTTLFTGAENHAQQIYLRAGLAPVRRFAVMVKPLMPGARYDQVHF